MYSLMARLFILLPVKAVLGIDLLIAAACLIEDSLWPVSPYNG
jgi:hypothetical protein